MKQISALIQHHAGPTGGVLICKNGDGAWEFPHDTVRTNETDREAVIRLAWEQLGIKVTAGRLAMIGHKKPHDGESEHILCGNITHDTHTKSLHHWYYEAVNKWQAEPKSDVYSECRWVHPSELSQYGFAGDDENFLAKYSPWVTGREVPDVRMY